MTKKTTYRKISLILCIVLIAAMALFTTGCNDNSKSLEKITKDSGAVMDATTEESNVKLMGEGDHSFFFTVTDKDGKETRFEIHTDKTVVGDALQELKLIAGDDSEYGLYVKEVNGITADYDKDGVYWAFYIDGAYASTGVSSTDITEGAEYSFKVEK
ncbi:MAG: DUF4430 domain-containing protein [Butyrivibrio sp.]